MLGFFFQEKYFS